MDNKYQDLEKLSVEELRSLAKERAESDEKRRLINFIRTGEHEPKYTL